MNNDQATRFRRLSRRVLLAGAGAGVLAGVGAVFRLEDFLVGYLSAFVLWNGAALGAAALLMIHHLVQGRWGRSIRAPLESWTATVPVCALLFLPIGIGIAHLYPWAGQEVTGEGFREWYLQASFFRGRAVVVLVIWSLGGVLLSWWSRASDRRAWAARVIPAGAALGLVLYVLTASFAEIDWVGTLAEHWYSSVFGLYLLVGQVLTALALIVVLMIACAEDKTKHALDADRLQDLGSLLLTFIVLHAYLAYSQFFIVWNGNLPHHAAWYVPRMEGIWGGVSVFLMAVHFGLPFVALLFKAVKRNARRLLSIAAVILIARAVESAWMVIPSTEGGHWVATLFALLSLVGMGGLWLALVGWIWVRTAASRTTAHEGQSPT